MEVCTQCYAGYVLNQNGLCEVKIPGCVYQYGKCISCSYPFKKVGEKCVIEGCKKYREDGCQECVQPFEAVRGSCVIPYCQELENGVCRKCESSYHVVEGRCYRMTPSAQPIRRTSVLAVPSDTS